MAKEAARHGGRIALAILSILVLCVLGLIGALLLSSPGAPKPFLDQDGKPLAGSVSEKVRIGVNGVEQGMFLKSRDAGHPVLLYLHGGLPDYFLTAKHPTGLEDDFTVAWWEQRGSGLSYHANLPRASLTLEQMISDTLVVTDYLRRRFGKEKIYLMGHSGGTFIGVHAAARAPERYHAYIGVAQMAHQLQSEIRAYEYMLERYRELGDQQMVRKLEATPVSIAGGVPAAYLALRDPAMHRLGIGTMRELKSVVTGIFLPSLTFPEYTAREKLNLWRGKAQSGVSALWGRMLATDLSTEVPELALPVYFLHGRFDYTCTYAEAKAYFENLKAPVKGFYTFEDSAHSPIFEEPARTRRILREDVLTGGNAHADAK